MLLKSEGLTLEQGEAMQPASSPALGSFSRGGQVPEQPWPTDLT